MKIFVTGGSGFIGSNFIIKQVTELKNNILNYDKLTYAGNIDNLFDLECDNNYQFINGDICDKNLLFTSIQEFTPDAIIHFASETHVDRSIDDPMKFIHTNIVGTGTLLSAASQYYNNIKDKSFKFLHISTDEVFGSLKNDGYFNESMPYLPNSPYSASKASSDHLVRAWFKTYKLPVLTTICSNNYGPYQFPEKLIPLMIANCIDEKPLPIYGRGLNVRDWLFVEDHCDAIYEVLINGAIGQTYNIGGNNEKSNIDLVNRLCEILDDLSPRENGNTYKKLITYVSDRPGHDYRYAIDSTKIKNELKWTPRYTFEKGIKKTIQWYLANESWWRKIQNENYNQERLGLKK